MMVKIPFPQALNMVIENADISNINSTPRFCGRLCYNRKKIFKKYEGKMRVLAFLIIMFQANITDACSEINEM